MKQYDEKCRDVEPRWFTVFRITDTHGKHRWQSYWGLHDAIPTVTQQKYLSEGARTFEKYCVSMARCLEERDAIVRKIMRAAREGKWEDEE